MEEKRNSTGKIILIVIAILILLAIILFLLYKFVLKQNNEVVETPPTEEIEIDEPPVTAGEDLIPVLPETDDVDEEDKQGDEIPDEGFTDLASIVAGLPGEEAMEEFYKIFQGYWITEESSFIGFIQKDGKYTFETGLFETSYWEFGEVVDVVSVNALEASFHVYFAAKPATEMDGAREEYTSEILIDFAEFEASGAIKIPNATEDGVWMTFIYAAADETSAYNAWKAS